MMKEQPSPGPWAVVQREECSGVKLVDRDGEFIEYLNESRYVDERKDPEQEANLHVIGAAMDLLAASKLALTHLSGTCRAPAVQAELRAAIAKAEGGDA